MATVGSPPVDPVIPPAVDLIVGITIPPVIFLPPRFDLRWLIGACPGGEFSKNLFVTNVKVSQVQGSEIALGDYQLTTSEGQCPSLPSSPVPPAGFIPVDPFNFSKCTYPTRKWVANNWTELDQGNLGQLIFNIEYRSASDFEGRTHSKQFIVFAEGFPRLTAQLRVFLHQQVLMQTVFLSLGVEALSVI